MLHSNVIVFLDSLLNSVVVERYIYFPCIRIDAHPNFFLMCLCMAYVFKELEKNSKLI